MVGGIVIGLARRSDGVTLLHVQDMTYRTDTCSVRCRDNGQVQVGDQVWWQCGKVYWTPAGNAPNGRCGVDYDRPLPKVGCLH